MGIGNRPEGGRARCEGPLRCGYSPRERHTSRMKAGDTGLQRPWDFTWRPDYGGSSLEPESAGPKSQGQSSEAHPGSQGISSTVPGDLSV